MLIIVFLTKKLLKYLLGLKNKDKKIIILFYKKKIQEYIKDKPNKFVGNEDKTVYIKEINNHFHCDINKEAEDLIAKHTYKKFLKEKFNGKMVSDWTGLQGEELGKVIKSYKDSIGDFDNFIQLKTTQNIEKNFREFFKSIS